LENDWHHNGKAFFVIDVYGMGVGDVEDDDEDNAWKAEEEGSYDEEFLGEWQLGGGGVDQGEKDQEELGNYVGNGDAFPTQSLGWVNRNSTIPCDWRDSHREGRCYLACRQAGVWMNNQPQLRLPMQGPIACRGPTLHLIFSRTSSHSIGQGVGG